MSDLRVGDWTVIGDRLVEVIDIAEHGTLIVRPVETDVPLPPPTPVVLSGWAGEGDVPPIEMPRRTGRDVDTIREAMRLARDHPGREIVFEIPDPEDPDAPPA